MATRLPSRPQLGLFALLTSAAICAVTGVVIALTGWQPGGNEVLALVALAALVVTGFTVSVLERTVRSSLDGLRSHVREFAESSGCDVTDRDLRDPSLAIRKLRARDEERRRELLETARMAGMSDVTSALVHGIGNILTSVKGSTDAVEARMTQMGVEDFKLLVEELERNAAVLPIYLSADPHGRFVVPYLTAMARCLDHTRDEVRAELQSVVTGIEEVVDLVRVQDAYSAGKGLPELTRLSDELDHAIAICRVAGAAGPPVAVRREYERVPPIVIDRSKLQSILVAVLRNAFEAVGFKRVGQRIVTVRLRPGEGRKTTIEVVDTGAGIPAEHLSLVFTLGYTTKPGHRGMGLHMAANSSRELGAVLGIQTRPIGAGSALVLHLPQGASPDGSAIAAGSPREVEDTRESHLV